MVVLSKIHSYRGSEKVGKLKGPAKSDLLSKSSSYTESLGLETWVNLQTLNDILQVEKLYLLNRGKSNLNFDV